MTGYIHSLQSLGTVDGPGVRAVVFASGCPLRCVYCHNPDTWDIRDGTPSSAAELAERIGRLYPYIKDGGVTFSGGEPCMQAEFFSELACLLRKKGLHIALDTSGCILNDATRRLLSLCDLVLLDVKMTTKVDYEKYTRGSIDTNIAFLRYLSEQNIPVWIRHVIVPGINDTEADVLRLKEMLSSYSNIERVELLPFKKLCLEKYDSLGIPFPLRNTEEMGAQRLRELTKLVTRTN